MDNIQYKVDIGGYEITLSKSLLDKLYKEVSKQLGEKLKGRDIEVSIEICHTETAITDESSEPLSDFNKKLKQALLFNPKNK